MKRHLLIATFLLATVAPAHAQRASDSTNVLSAYLRRSYAAFAKDFAAAVEMMPEYEFGFRPAGATSEVRTFGALVAHIAATNAFVCSMGDGKPDPNKEYARTSEELSAIATNKARLIAFMNETHSRCAAYLETLTDAALTQSVTAQSGAVQLRAFRGNGVVFVLAHSNEHYGNLVTYLRAKGLVPPRAAAQAAFFEILDQRKF